MLRKLVLGLGAAGLMAGSSDGQFASDKNLPPAKAGPAPFGGAAPAPAMPARPTLGPTAPPPGGYVPPVGGFTPAAGTAPRPALTPSPLTPAPAAAPVVLPTALPANHPFLLRPEHGGYVILLRSYSRPARPDPANPGLSARELAEGLLADLQRRPETKGFGLYLYEYVSEERKAEAQAQADARARAAAFTASVAGLKQQSQLNGMDFLDPDVKLRYKTFNYRDQIGIMVGGFRTEDDAVKTLARVRAWPAPADTRLLDGGAIVKHAPNGKSVVEKTYLNPYAQALVVPNPTVPRPAMTAAAGLDPFVVKLNDGRPYSLLKATKTWTLGVRAFNADVRVQNPDEEGVGVRLFGMGKTGDVLNAGAEQAELLAKNLRELKGGKEHEYRPLNLEAFVLHHRTGSMVTVGQYDSPDDPALHATRRMLEKMTFTATDPRVGESARRMFHETIIPIPIPKP